MNVIRCSCVTNTERLHVLCCASNEHDGDCVLCSASDSDCATLVTMCSYFVNFVCMLV